jgi:hypothetical protein
LCSWIRKDLNIHHLSIIHHTSTYSHCLHQFFPLPFRLENPCHQDHDIDKNEWINHNQQQQHKDKDHTEAEEIVTTGAILPFMMMASKVSSSSQWYGHDTPATALATEDKGKGKDKGQGQRQKNIEQSQSATAKPT